MQLTLSVLDGRYLAAKSITIFPNIYVMQSSIVAPIRVCFIFISIFIDGNQKLLGENKRTNRTPEVERPVYTTVDHSHFWKQNVKLMEENLRR